MTRKYFGTDGIRGPANGLITPEWRCRSARRPAGVSARRPPPSRRDRQGHAAFGLHDRIGDGGGLYLGRHGRAPARPDADAGGGDADAVDARRSRRDDLGFPQPVRRQRHQAVRPGWLQADRRRRTADRGAARRTARASRLAQSASFGRARASMACRTATSNSPSAPCRATQPRGVARGDRLRQRCGLQGGSGGAVGARR